MYLERSRVVGKGKGGGSSRGKGGWILKLFTVGSCTTATTFFPVGLPVGAALQVQDRGMCR